MTYTQPAPSPPSVCAGQRWSAACKSASNVTIVPRVTIGAYSLIGSGAVVTHDIPPHSLVVGNPGRVIKQIEAIFCTTNVAPGGPQYHPYAHLLTGSESAQ